MLVLCSAWQNMNRMVMSNKNRRLYTKMLKQQVWDS